MIQLRQAVIVEGKYDQIRLSSLIDATIIPVGGFRIYRDKELLELIKLLARRTGIIILTDSDSAGFRIRSYLKSCVREGQVLHAYIPDVLGKEPRKAAPGKEGKLGVEGMETQALLQALSIAGACPQERAGLSGGEGAARRITKADLFADGFSGAPDSRAKRAVLLKRLGLPARMSSNVLLCVLNALYTYDEYRQLTSELTKVLSPGNK